MGETGKEMLTIVVYNFLTILAASETWTVTVVVFYFREKWVSMAEILRYYPRDISNLGDRDARERSELNCGNILGTKILIRV